MPILNVVRKVKSGKAGVLEWNGTAEEFSEKLTNPESSVLVKIDDNRLLLSVGPEDADLLSESVPYSPRSLETSIYIPRRIKMEEEVEIILILDVLINNGSIQEHNLNIRKLASGTFVNFPHTGAKDCALVRPFIEYITLIS